MNFDVIKLHGTTIKFFLNFCVNEISSFLSLKIIVLSTKCILTIKFALSFKL